MWRTQGYVLQQIGESKYLLPYGQMIAECRHGMRLNEAGVFLWEKLSEVKDKEELLEQFMAFCEAEPEEKEMVRQDMEEFLTQFSAWGMYREELSAHERESESDFLIAGLRLKIKGDPELVPKEFLPFRAPSPYLEEETDLTMFLSVTSGILPFTFYGNLLIDSADLAVCEQEEHYHLRYPRLRQIRYALVSKDAKTVWVNCLDSKEIGEETRDQLFHAIRPIFLYAAQKQGLFAIHSASLLYQEKAWVFSAPSGTGKSTHTNLWKKQFSTPVINGDLNLLSIRDGVAMVHGLPWCGTSQISDTGDYPLGGIIFLKQAPFDEIRSLSREEKVLSVMQRFISPVWTKEQMLCNFHFSEELIRCPILIERLFCTKEPSAAVVMKRRVDERRG